jgi:hypothetical protein
MRPCLCHPNRETAAPALTACGRMESQASAGSQRAVKATRLRTANPTLVWQEESSGLRYVEKTRLGYFAGR